MKKVAASLCLFFLLFSLSFAGTPPLPPVPSGDEGQDLSGLITEMEEAGFVLGFQDGYDEEWEFEEWLGLDEGADFIFPETNTNSQSSLEESELEIIDSDNEILESEELVQLDFLECLDQILEGNLDEEMAEMYCESFQEDLYQDFGVESVDELMEDHGVDNLDTADSPENLEQKWQEQEAQMDEMVNEVSDEFEEEEIEEIDLEE